MSQSVPATECRSDGRMISGVHQGIEEIVRKQEEELTAAFDLLAQYPDECDVEYAAAAQAEVVLRG